YAFVAWRGRDQQAEIPHPVFNGLHKQLYASNSGNLSVTYSYSQRSCVTDNSGNSSTDICSEEKVEYYFQNKKLDINITADGLAEAVIPLTNEYLNAPDKLPWYLAPVSRTIHRIDLYVCDETQNCLQYVARFRVNVLADGPVVNVLDLPETSKNIFKDINSFLTASHNKPIVTRLFEIVNPTAYPVYFTLAENQSPTTMYVQRQTYKRINAYYKRTTTVKNTGRTQVYSGGQTSDNRYRCNYKTSYHNVGSIVELLSDTLPATTGRISTSGEVRHYGSCARGGSRTSSVRAAGYPKNVDSRYLTPLGTGSASELSFPMNYHSAVDENNVAYNPESYWLLAPGASKRISIQETLPLYSTYDDGDLSVPSTYTQTSAYNWKGAVYINQGVKIKFGRADYSGLLEPSSVIEFSQAHTKPVGVITTERFTVLPGTPR
ncbi:MAG: hypothetical protein K0U41_00615, partial [Gammaproteobacteria bacterium]|nr:hypothetical protein [Gammaproteobacteria bacterium]